jgi:hypothetical protein
MLTMTVKGLCYLALGRNKADEFIQKFWYDEANR